MATGRASGKLLLFGEHAVLYGEPAFGCPLGVGVTAEVTAGRGALEVTGAAGIAVDPGHPGIRDLVARALGPRRGALDVHLHLAIPPMSGLGTSGAIAIALLRAVGELPPSTSADALPAALERIVALEHAAHAVSSGVDPAIVLAERPIRYWLEGEARRVEPLSLPRPVHLVVGAVGQHGGTSARVSAVRAFRDRAPALAEAVMRLLGTLGVEGARALGAPDLELAGRAMDLAHGALSGLGLVGPRLEANVRELRALGALGAKMSGAGGDGGAFVGLAEDERRAAGIAETLRARGVFALALAVSG